MPDHSQGSTNEGTSKDQNAGRNNNRSSTTAEAVATDPLLITPTPRTATTITGTSLSFAVSTASPIRSVSHATVDALGDWLESASVQSIPAAQEQRRKDNYKSSNLIAKSLKQSQEERRKQALAEQAKKRYQFTNHARKLALFASGQSSEDSSGSEDDDAGDANEEDDDDDDDDSSDKKLLSDDKNGDDHRTGSIAQPATVMKPHKRRLSSGSESEHADGPMTEIPLDLDTSYYIVPLPIGHRCFVISADGKTTARLPSGQLLVGAFESCLPAGSNAYRGNRRADYCILDCVYSSVTRTFWTLDIMCWRGHPVYECETEFRFWWLRGKLAEIESLQSKWITTQTREWEQELAKKRQKRTKQVKRRQEKAAAASAAAVTATLTSSNGVKSTDMDMGSCERSGSVAQTANDHEDGDDGDDEAGTEGMDMDDDKTGLHQQPKKFWPIVFTPLPYFNASTNLVRLLAESMHSTSDSSAPTSSVLAESNGQNSSQRSVPNNNEPALSKSSNGQTAAISSSVSQRTTTTRTILGTMALSGEIATAASSFPAHDNAQKARQDSSLYHERAAGLVFFNKKTMYVLGTTPLCGWVAMDQVGDVFFDEEGGVGPVPGTSAVEGREVEMEDALERIRI
ncbi:hypothetical protein BGZ83_006422 [Gryganskiella cystojenkinii]|nr:hypothetical protein BGZ83_006422 [Gryganskiella cystojenkinii]